LLPYFPFKDDTFKMAMGVQALDSGCLIEIDPAYYQSELMLKNELLLNAYHDYFQALPESERMQWDVVEVVLQNMALHYPHYFTLIRDGDDWIWHNQLLREETRFVFGKRESLPQEPLDWVGRQVQEDLLVLQSTQEGGSMALVAGQLCFPNAWCLDDKMEQTFLDIHQSVPLFAEYLGRSSTLLLERLKVGRPVWRVNWSMKATDRLNHTPRFHYEEQQASQEITHENIGERCFLRIERQALIRLPRTNAVLFTIHTYQSSLAQVVDSVERARRLFNVVKTMPEEVLTYKAMSPFAPALLSYLAAQCGDQGTIL
jgi:dimethylamine monooxygenase subunit A